MLSGAELLARALGIGLPDVWPLEPELLWILGGYDSGGRDFAGTPLIAELERWFEVEGVDDEGVRSAARILWGYVAAEHAAVADERELEDESIR